MRCQVNRRDLLMVARKYDTCRDDVMVMAFWDCLSEVYPALAQVALTCHRLPLSDLTRNDVVINVLLGEFDILDDQEERCKLYLRGGCIIC